LNLEGSGSVPAATASVLRAKEERRPYVGTSSTADEPDEEGEFMNDLAAMFDAHVKAEFQNLDLEATMSTMTDDPYVHHVPTITGGNGTAGVRDFYGHHFIGQWPDDTETRQVSRTVGENQVVDELMMAFTHDRPLDIMLPGIPPTGRRIAVAVVVVVGFENGRVSHEHIYWDQATVLVQAGLLDPSGLPIVGSEQAKALLDQERPKNEVFGSDA
jgi:carboxymethylenebutenolidase